MNLQVLPRQAEYTLFVTGGQLNIRLLHGAETVSVLPNALNTTLPQRMCTRAHAPFIKIGNICNPVMTLMSTMYVQESKCELYV